MRCENTRMNTVKFVFMSTMWSEINSIKMWTQLRENRRMRFGEGIGFGFFCRQLTNEQRQKLKRDSKKINKRSKPRCIYTCNPFMHPFSTEMNAMNFIRIKFIWKNTAAINKSVVYIVIRAVDFISFHTVLGTVNRSC